MVKAIGIEIISLFDYLTAYLWLNQTHLRSPHYFRERLFVVARFARAMLLLASVDLNFCL